MVHPAELDRCDDTQRLECVRKPPAIAIVRKTSLEESVHVYNAPDDLTIALEVTGRYARRML